MKTLIKEQGNDEKPVFIVDDEPEILVAVDTTLRMAGLNNIITISDSRNVIGLMERQMPRLVLLDLNMPHINGVSLLKIIRKTWPEIPVIVLTGAIEVDTAVQCMKIGAVDYLVKPVAEERLLAVVDQTLGCEKFAEADKKGITCDMSFPLNNPKAFRQIITQDKKMYSIFQYVESIAPSSQPVLIFGETGVGKELICQVIHGLSQRKGKLVKVNVAGLDDNVFSDTLFGHVPGAFTGADKTRSGLIEQAVSGTLFLDEIGDLSLTSQIKLLRLLQEGEYRPLGSDCIHKSDVRILASTNLDLWALEKKGRFRKDLIYRLSIHSFTLPPLRERLLDLPLLLDRFVCHAATELGKSIPDISQNLIAHMETYPFEGNIRELNSMVYDAVSRYKKGSFTLDLFKAFTPNSKGHGRDEPANLPTLKEASRELVEKALKKTRGNQSAAARILGISQQALSKRIKKLKSSKK